MKASYQASKNTYISLMSFKHIGIIIFPNSEKEIQPPLLYIGGTLSSFWMEFAQVLWQMFPKNCHFTGTILGDGNNTMNKIDKHLWNCGAYILV